MNTPIWRYIGLGAIICLAWLTWGEQITKIDAPASHKISPYIVDTWINAKDQSRRPEYVATFTTPTITMSEFERRGWWTCNDRGMSC